MVKQCQRCGKEFDVRPNNFKLAKWCPLCRPTVYREQVRERSRRWHKADREKSREYSREYARRYYIKQKLKILRGEVST